jgi:ribosomal protein S7
MEPRQEALISLYAIVERTAATSIEEFKKTLLRELMREIDKDGAAAHDKRRGIVRSA